MSVDRSATTDPDAWKASGNEAATYSEEEPPAASGNEPGAASGEATPGQDKLTTLTFTLVGSGADKRLVIDFDGWAKSNACAAYRNKLRQYETIKIVEDPTPLRIMVKCNVIEEIAPAPNDANFVSIRGIRGNIREISQYLPQPRGGNIVVGNETSEKEYVALVPRTFKSAAFVSSIGGWPIIQASHTMPLIQSQKARGGKRFMKRLMRMSIGKGNGSGM